MKYKHPLQTDNFSFWDRLKAARFILDKRNRLTMGPKVKELEDIWGVKSATKVLATSSGSTANHLLVETFLQTHGFRAKDVTFFCPATTWASSVSPIIMRGCNVTFVDINAKDFSFNYKELEDAIQRSGAPVKVIWPTALIGFIPDINELKKLSKKYDAFLFADLCECTLGYYEGRSILGEFDMATTSLFWAHEVCSIEGGMLFVKNQTKLGQSYALNASSIRSHGLVRNLPEKERDVAIEKHKHLNIDKEFLFERIGTNYRMSDLHAFFGVLDSKRIGEYEKHREKIWKYFNKNMGSRYYSFSEKIIPFCLPIISRSETDVNIIKTKLNILGWETRPIISFLPLNPAYKMYGFGQKFPISQMIHDRGFYVGLNKDTSFKQLDKLIEILHE